jgi:hypothetical protein
MAVKKKNSPKKTVKKVIPNKKLDLQTFLHYFYWVLAIVSVLAAAMVVGFYIGYNQAKEESACIIDTHKQKHIKLQKQIERLTSKTAKHEYGNAAKPPKAKPRTVHKALKGKKGKLAIIFDDVSFKGDVKHIKALGYPLTMSFLPPTKRHPNSAKLAAKESYYMVHLPMEAMNFHSPEKFTLLTTDSKETIVKRIKQVKQWFPKVKYINNHTGSKFTSDTEAMNKLIFALRLEKIGFIDSRTTAKTVAEKVMKRYKMPYYTRDVFLDHDDDVDAIKKQIKKAIRIANKYGKCIAICHPHKSTLQALRESKKELEGVELVRIDKLTK